MYCPSFAVRRQATDLVALCIYEGSVSWALADLAGDSIRNRLSCRASHSPETVVMPNASPSALTLEGLILNDRSLANRHKKQMDMLFRWIEILSGPQKPVRTC